MRSTDLFGVWYNTSESLHSKKILLTGTYWNPMYQVKGNRKVETWVYLEPEKKEWGSICVDGTAEVMDEKKILKL